MEQKSSYVLIGAFVFIFSFCIVAAILWIQGNSSSVSYKYYKINTNETVTGLSSKAVVLFNGLSVGEVTNLSINKENLSEISIIIKVLADTPITEDTRATIESKGITGLSFVQLSGGTQDSKLLKTSSEEDEYGIIKSSPSILSRVDNSLSGILNSTRVTIDQIGKIASDDNLKNIETILANVANITTILAATSTQLEKRVDQFNSVLNKAVQFEESAILAANGIMSMSKSLKSTIDNVNSRIEGGEFNFKTAIDNNLAPIQLVASELEILLNQIRQSLESLSISPSDIIFKSGKVKPGPGE